jgi:hypothetical protein
MTILQPNKLGWYPAFDNPGEIYAALSYPCSGGVTYEVQESTDLVTWTTTRTFTLVKDGSHVSYFSLQDNTAVRVVGP